MRSQQLRHDDAMVRVRRLKWQPFMHCLFHSPDGGLCYEEIEFVLVSVVELTLIRPIIYPSHIEKYLNRLEIQQVLGTDSAVSNFTGVSMSVLTMFENGLDFVFPTTHYLTALLERGVRVLLFVGVNDWACNWVGTSNLSLRMGSLTRSCISSWATSRCR